MSRGSDTRNELEVIHVVDHASIVFHGSLAKYGSFRGRVGTPGQILNAAFTMRPGLRQAIREGEFKLYRNEIIEGRELSERGLGLMLQKGQKLHIVPVAKGSKGKGASIGKTIAGAVIAVVAVVAAIPSGGGSIIGGLAAEASIMGTGLGVSYAAIAVFGAMMMMGGIAGLVGVKSSKTSTGKDSSTSMSGASNDIGQGGCIPLIYGRDVRTGSSVISLGYSAQEWSNTDGNADDNPSGMITTSSETGTGSKGKGGGSSSHETPNNLRSKAVVQILDLIGQGPGVELKTGSGEEGAKSIFFNGTPLMAADGTYNFEGVRWAWRDGSEDQEPVPGFPAGENTVQIGTEVKSGQPVIQTINSETATSARVVVNFPALYRTDTKSGVLGVGPDVNVIVELRQGSGAWQTVVNDTLSGKKCTSSYERAYKFSLPGAESGVTTWDIRVSRNSPDSTSAGDASAFYFQTIDVITEHLLIYPKSAYCALVFDSSVFGDSVPTRTYAVKGKEVRVPANYDNDTRTYATTGAGTENGTWDGISWKIVNGCDDPCWCLLDLIASTDYGYAVPESRFGSIETDLYEASQYAAQLVDDGFGGKESRYALNVAIKSAGDAYKVLGQFTSVFRALAYWTAGGIAISADMPREPVMLVTNANVVDGNFSYEGTALSGRHNLAYCTFTNQQNITAFPDMESYTDNTSVISSGVRSTKIEGFGCTSRGQALRQAHWLVDTEIYQNQTVTYQCGIDHASVRPGEVIQIADMYYQGVRQGGRVATGATTTRVPLDKGIDLEAGLTYTLKTIADDGSISASYIQNIEVVEAPDGQKTYTAILKDALSSAPSVNTIWMITEPTKFDLPQFRVMTVLDKGKGLYQITAIFHDPAKYDRVEKNLPFNEKQYSQLPNLLPSPLPPPSDISVQDYTVGEGTTTIVRTDIGWKQSSDARILGYQTRAVNTATKETQTFDAGNTGIYSIDNLSTGTWICGVRSYGKNGTVSAWVDGTATLIDGKPQPPGAVLGLTALGGTRRVSLSWQMSTIRNVLDYEIQRAPDDNGVPGTFSTITYVAATSYTDTDSKNLMPETVWWYRVRVRDTYQTLGDWTDAVKATTTYLLTDDLEQDIQDTAKTARALLEDVGTPIVMDDGQLPPINAYPEKTVISAGGILYRKENNSWNQLIAGVTIDQSGKLVSTQIGQIPSVNVEQSLTSEQVALLQKASQDSSLTADQKKQVDDAAFAGSASQDVMNLVSNVLQKLNDENLNNLSFQDISRGLTDDQQREIDLAKLAGKASGQQIDADSVRAVILTAGSIVSDMIATNAITSDKISANSISADKIVSNSIGSDQIDANSIRSAVLISGSVTTATLAANSVTAEKADIHSLTTAILTANSIVSSMISAGSITGDKVAANTITGNNIAAQSITADKLFVANINNVLPNSCGDIEGQGYTGWSTGWSSTGSAKPILRNVSSPNKSLPDATWANWYCAGTGSFAVYFQGTLQNNEFVVVGSQSVQIAGGQTVAGSIRLFDVTGVCEAWVSIRFFDSSGTMISDASGPTTKIRNLYGGTSINNYSLHVANGVAPVNAVTTQLLVNIRNTSSDYGNGGSSYVILTQGQIAFLKGGDTLCPAWTPASSTAIDGGQIKTGTVIADKIAANSVTSDKIAGNSVTADKIASNSITSDKIVAGAITGDKVQANSINGNVLIGNSVYASALVANSITAAQMQAGAIGTDQLAARAITADKLAVQELIVDHAQIGSLVVGTDHMQDNSITVYGTASGGSSSISVDIYCARPTVGIMSVRSTIICRDDGQTMSSMTTTMNPGSGIMSQTKVVNAPQGMDSFTCPVSLPAGTTTVYFGVTGTGGNSNGFAQSLYGVFFGRLK